jgi:outer membrane protein TolC
MRRDIAEVQQDRRLRRLGAGFVVLGPLLLGACGLRPAPITAEQHAARAEQDYATLAKNYVPVSGPLTEAGAIARALKYNYDAALSRMEQTLQEREIDLALSQMLPRLAADAGYNERSNDNAATSISELTKTQSLEPSYSTERRHFTADLAYSWNLLDVGVSYFQARQQGYRALVAVERRRKVIDGIVKGVQDAFWKAAVAQTLLPRLDPVLADAQHMLDAARRTTAARLQPEMQSLDYEENLLQVIAQLRHMRTDLLTARARLASLIAVPPEAPFTLVPPPEVALARPTGVDMVRLETTALDLRPELREAAYQEKIDRQDIYKEIVKMMPGIGILGGLNYDSDRLLYNHSWADFGVRATFNLMNLIQGPQALAAANAAVDVSKARRLALGVAVLTQFNIGYREYVAALDDLATATEIDSVEQQIARAATNASAAEAQPEAMRVRRQLAAMVADYDKARAEGDAYSALANIYTAVGTDLVPPDIALDDLGALTQRVSASLDRWKSGALPAPVVPAMQAAAPAATVVATAAR